MFKIITDLEGNKFKVTLLSNKTFKNLFEYEFTVYSGFDRKGLIEDAIFMFKNN